MTDLPYLLWLYSLKGVGNATALSLLKRFESAKTIYEMHDLRDLAETPNLSKVAAESILQKKSLDNAHRVIDRMQQNSIGIVSYFDPAYPSLLRSIDSAPLVLFYKGENLFEHYDPAVAIVGSRHATTYGLNQAYKMAKDLAQSGLTVVSGLATGIDRASHIGAMDGEGLTIGVLGCGVDVIYPRGSRKAYDAMLAGGHMIISEFLPGTEPFASNFPRRNRIISGLCLGTVIVEATVRSGSLITANYAAEQGREVFALPGNTTSKMSEGTNALLRDGAKFVMQAEDVLRELYPELKAKLEERKASRVRSEAPEPSAGAPSPAKASPEPYGMSEEENAVYECIRSGVCTKDELVRALGYTISQINTLVTLLELGGYIVSENGKLYII